MKTRFGDLSKVSKTNRIIASIAIISLISLVIYVAIPEEKETLEVYSFELEVEIRLKCDQPVNYTNIALAEVCPPASIYPVKTLYVFLNVEKGMAQITSQLQLNETEIGLLWSITVAGVTANTSRGFIKCQELEQVSFLPPRMLIVVASFDFLLESYTYQGLLLPTLDLPSFPPNKTR